LAGLPRGKIQDSGTGELDVMLQYGSEADTAVTVYVFRPRLMSVPLWFDRAEAQILARDIFGHPVPQGPARAFAPPRASVAAGLQRSYVPGKGPFKATGLAILPLNNWLVAVRASSVRLDPVALDGVLAAVLAAITCPSDVAQATTIAAPIQPCATPLAYAGKAKFRPADTSESLFGALLAGAASAQIKKDDEAPKTWCREAEGGPLWAAYRAEGGADSYTIALGDAGNTISVFPAYSLKAQKNDGYRLTLSRLAQTYVYPNLDKLPKPGDALKAVQKARPISSTSFDGKNININLPNL
jgi:hypothetical protein